MKLIRFPTALDEVNLLQWGLVFSGLCGDAFRFAFAWWVLKTTGSAAEFGLILTMGTAVQTVTKLTSGALGDLVGPLRLVRGAIGCQTALIILMAGWTFYGSFEFFFALLVMVLLSITNGAIETLTNVALAEIAPTGKMTETMARRGAFGSASKLVGPLLASASIAAAGVSGAMAMGAAFCIIGWALACMVYKKPTHPEVVTDGLGGFLSKWGRDSVRSVIVFSRIRVDFWLCLVTCGINLGLPAFFIVLLPYLVIHVYALPPSLLGIFDALFCAGMFLGGMRTVGWLNARFGKLTAMFFSILVLSSMVLTLAVTDNPFIIGIAMFVGGTFMLSVFANVGGLRAVATPATYRGRVFAAATFLTSISTAPGIALCTLLLGTFGVTVTLAVVAAIMVAAVASIYLIPNAKDVLAMSEEQAKDVYQVLYPAAFPGLMSQNPGSSQLRDGNA